MVALDSAHIREDAFCFLSTEPKQMGLRRVILSDTEHLTHLY